MSEIKPYTFYFKEENLTLYTTHDTGRKLAGIMQTRQEEIDRLKAACSKMNDDVCQILGKALNYPKFVDDPIVFPNATEEDGVCVGDHVAESLAMEAADCIKTLKELCK